jgi:RHS repeat-associated protein
VVKTAVDASSNERHTVYVFGSLELRGAVFESGEYADTKATEVVYLFAHGVRVGRLHHSEDSLPTLTSGKLHVLLELPDHLGSSSIVIDKGTGELAERTTYLAYGGTESDYRPERWGSFREDYKFTGKEEDEEVGLQYFGKRFFAPGLGRWISPDPLAVHAPGEADLNLYAYVHGNALKAVDPNGLQPDPSRTEEVESDAPSGPAFDVAPDDDDRDLENFKAGIQQGVLDIGRFIVSAASMSADAPWGSVRRANELNDQIDVDYPSFSEVSDPNHYQSLGRIVFHGSIMVLQLAVEAGGGEEELFQITDSGEELKVPTPETTPDLYGGPDPVGGSKSGDAVWHAERYQAALDARDDVLRAFRLTDPKDYKGVATVLGCYNTETGEVAVGTKWFSGERYCAENVLLNKLGGDPSKVVMTPAIRPWGMKMILVCEMCQKVFPKSAFGPGVEFRPPNE